MRIDIGRGGKILGTKKVSPNGQVSGLKEYAGQEVLVILPGASGGEGPEEFAAEFQSLVQDQMNLAFKQSKWLSEKYATPFDAMREFLRSANPGAGKNFQEMFDEWVKAQKKWAQGKER
jgi:hypothetical protein